MTFDATTVKSRTNPSLKRRARTDLMIRRGSVLPPDEPVLIGGPDLVRASQRVNGAAARGALVESECTATARTPASVKKSAMKSAWRVEQQKARVRVPGHRRYCSRAFRPRDRVATACVRASSSNRVLRQGMFR
jgi:hypothetical protein